MPRQGRLDTPGTLHHVMIRGIEKRRIVDDDQDRRDFVSRLGRLSVETGTAVYAWALLTNHAHLLVCSGPQGLARFMRRLLTGYSVSYNLRHRTQPVPCQFISAGAISPRGSFGRSDRISR